MSRVQPLQNKGQLLEEEKNKLHDIGQRTKEPYHGIKILTECIFSVAVLFLCNASEFPIPKLSVLDKGPSGLKVLAIVINAKVRKAFDCSGEKNLGSC